MCALQATSHTAHPAFGGVGPLMMIEVLRLVEISSKPAHSRVRGMCVCVWGWVGVIGFGKYLLGTCRVRNVGVCDTASGHVPLAARPQTHLSLPAADSTGRRWLSIYGTLFYGTPSLSLFYSTIPSRPRARTNVPSNSLSVTQCRGNLGRPWRPSTLLTPPSAAISRSLTTWPSLRLHQVSNSISISLFQL